MGHSTTNSSDALTTELRARLEDASRLKREDSQNCVFL